MAVAELAEFAKWLRPAVFLCSVLAGVGTALASTTILLALVPIAALGALLPVHPFDLIYNPGIRHLTGTGPLVSSMTYRALCGGPTPRESSSADTNTARDEVTCP